MAELLKFPEDQPLVERIKAAYGRAIAGESEWRFGTIQLAEALAEARARFKANQEFHQWLVQQECDFLSRDDRAALVGMGRNLELARETLAKKQSFSWRLVWQDMQDQIDGERATRGSHSPGGRRVRSAAKTDEVAATPDKIWVLSYETQEEDNHKRFQTEEAAHDWLLDFCGDAWGDGWGEMPDDEHLIEEYFRRTECSWSITLEDADTAPLDDDDVFSDKLDAVRARYREVCWGGAQFETPPVIWDNILAMREAIAGAEQAKAAREVQDASRHRQRRSEPAAGDSNAKREPDAVPRDAAEMQREKKTFHAEAIIIAEGADPEDEHALKRRVEMTVRAPDKDVAAEGFGAFIRERLLEAGEDYQIESVQEDEPAPKIEPQVRPEFARDVIARFQPSGFCLDPCRGTIEDGGFHHALPEDRRSYCEIAEGTDFLEWREPVDWIFGNPDWDSDTYRNFARHAFAVADNVVFLGPIGVLLGSSAKTSDYRAAGHGLVAMFEVAWEDALVITKKEQKQGHPLIIAHWQRGAPDLMPLWK
jgi:hypothetical protein